MVAYSIYNSRGKRIYLGSTNNPGRRAAQHARNGRLPRAGELVVESRPMSWSAAQQLGQEDPGLPAQDREVAEAQ